MLLYLLRHGDALDSPGHHDSDRPLSDKGIKQAENVAKFFKSSGISLDLIIASPLLRAQQMAEPTRNALAMKELLTSDYLVPYADHRQLFELLDGRKEQSVLCVGHEPFMSTAISLLVFGETSAHIEMKKASLACVETIRPLKKLRATFKWLVTAEQMK